MFTATTLKKGRHVLRPQLAALCTRQRVGAVSTDAQNLLVAGMVVAESAQVYQSVLMAQARTGKPCPTIQARDELAAHRMSAILPSTTASTIVRMTDGDKHPDRKRFNRATYEARKAARAAEAATGPAKSKKGTLKKKSAAAAEEEEAPPATPSKKGKRSRAE